MSKRKQVYTLLERDCVNPQTEEYIKDYILNISERNRVYEVKNKELGQELAKAQKKINGERTIKLENYENEIITKLKQQLEAKENENRRLNLDAQKWFDMAMELLYGHTKPEDYK